MMQVLWTLDNLVARMIALTANSFLLFYIDPWLMLFGLFPLLLGLLRRRERILQKKLDDERKSLHRRADYVRRTFYLNEYAKEMRSGSMFENMLRDLRETHAQLKQAMRKYGWKVALLGYLQSIGLEVFTVLGATLYAVWSTMVLGPENGGMQVGDCIVVLGSVGTISWCLSQLVQNIAEFGEHALYLEDIRYFLDYQAKVCDGERIAPEGGDIVFDHVSFRYDGAERDTLRDISFTLRRGERVALVGANGSGKTTLVKLLLRLYDPSCGCVLMDGIDAKSCTVRSWRDRFSTVFQDFKVFSMTVRDNVLLRRRQDGDEALVKQALQDSGMADKIESFEKGIETVLTREFDDNGENLSIGQQQKLSLARVFAEHTPVVVLDEPSSALDPIAEYQMFENMMRATEGRSVMFISHRLSSAVLADRVFLMENGQLTEIGSHAELMKKDGQYAAMFRRQAENYLGEEATAHV
jgi:ATP-binding cassette subfamily B protein